MNWQEWVVGLLIILCVARILYGIYVFFRRVKENDNPCASCASGCELKDMMDKKRKECSSKKKKTKKNCCGQFGSFKICTTFATANEKQGSLDEWLSQRSAKPCTAVRIRQEPPKAKMDQNENF